jgi:hypothetical protein
MMIKKRRERIISIILCPKIVHCRKKREMKGEFRLVGKLLIIFIMRHMHYKHDFFVDIISQNKIYEEIFISINIQVAILYRENMILVLRECKNRGGLYKVLKKLLFVFNLTNFLSLKYI